MRFSATSAYLLLKYFLGKLQTLEKHKKWSLLYSVFHICNRNAFSSKWCSGKKWFHFFWFHYPRKKCFRLFLFAFCLTFFILILYVLTPAFTRYCGNVFVDVCAFCISMWYYIYLSVKDRNLLCLLQGKCHYKNIFMSIKIRRNF